MTFCGMRAAIPGLAIKPVQGWPPAGRRVVGARRGLGYTIQNQSHFRHILCHSEISFFEKGRPHTTWPVGRARSGRPQRGCSL
jgi:hypothetical protein